MNTIPHLVDLGLKLRERIATLEAELETVEAALISHARTGDQVDLIDEEREGKQYLARGSAQTVPVVFTADSIIGSFADDSDIHKKIVAATGGYGLRPFYRRSITWKMIADGGKSFRKIAGEVLGNAVGPAFVTACLARDKHGIPKSDIKVEWKRAEKTP